MKRLLELLSLMFIISGIGGLLCGYVSPIMDSELLQSVEFPLSNVKNITSGKEKRVFAYCAFYSRIQLYDKNGKFVKNWIYKEKGNPRSWVDNKGILHLDNTHILDPDKGISSVPSVKPPTYTDEDIYRVKDNLIFPKIVKINDHDKIIVKTKYFAFWIFFIGPYPAIALAILGYIISKISEKLQK